MLAKFSVKAIHLKLLQYKLVNMELECYQLEQIVSVLTGYMGMITMKYNFGRHFL